METVLKPTLPLASPGREAAAARMFDTSISPEEYAARHAHMWVCFSFAEFEYRDTKLGTWIARLGDIIFGRNGAPTVRECRRKYLSDTERLEIEANLEDPI
jgi:hypothetical protein